MNISSTSVARHVPFLEKWPKPDQQLWQAGLVPGDILEGGAYAEGLRPATICGAAEGYWCWLGVLRQKDPLALLLPPADRVTPTRIRMFLEALRERGNTNNTIKTRFWELRSALRIMQPDRDFRWLNYPAGQSLHAMLPTTLRHVDVMRIDDLARWGQELMGEALQLPESSRRAVQYRNGLLVAMLANRAPRLGSIVTLRLGQGIVRSGPCYRLAFRVGENKGKKRLEYGLTEFLTPWIDHYLAVERAHLLAGATLDWFWINAQGKQLGIRGIEGVIRRGSLAQFGKAFGTHCFRHAFATANMIADPTTPGMVAAVLGNSPAVVEQSYALGGQLEAAARFHDALRTDRARTAGLARDAFKQ